MKKLLLPSLFILFLGAGCAKSPTILERPESTRAPVTPQVSMTSSTQASYEPTDAQVTLSHTLVPSAPNVKTGEPFRFPGILPKAELEHVHVRVKTKKGDMVFQLLPNEGPNAASNFAYLVKNGFYDGLVFHRVIPGFVAQGGDPMGADPSIAGRGGPGYQFPDDSVHLPYREGTLAMANSGPNTNGSQFFIVLDDHAGFDGPKYSIFGSIIEGKEVLKNIVVGDVMQSVTLEK